jgi:hypothetical protein
MAALCDMKTEVALHAHCVGVFKPKLRSGRTDLRATA